MNHEGKTIMWKALSLFWLFGCLCCLNLLFPSPGLTGEPEEYWEKIKQTASGEYGGLDLNPVLKTGYQFTGDYAGPGVGIQMDLPLWSKKKRLENRKAAIDFLAAGSDLVRKLETALNTLSLLEEQSKVLRALMSEEGVEGVKALFDCERQAIEQKALIDQHRRDLNSMIKPIGKSPAVQKASF
jgi:hypothetical protein